VTTKRDRDGALDQLLRQQAQTAAEGDAAGPCLDAETLSAWAEGGLKGYGQAMAEDHLATCARCQATLATLTRLSPPPEAPAPERWWELFLSVRWLAPFAAGALAVLVWIAMPSDRSPNPGSPQPTPPPARTAPGGQPQATESGENREQEAAALAANQKTLRAPADEKVSADSAKEETKAAPREERALAKQAGNEDAVGRLDATSAARDAAAAQSASPPAPAAASPAAELGAAKAASMPRQRFGAREVASPDPSVRWRVGPAGSVQHSEDSGATWETLPSEVTTDLLGAVSPSPTVCWVVGRAGTILLATDGRRFQRIPFPASADLVGVRATDARSATVVGSDGRTFTTADGGATWEMNPR
jgi:hypothetical protein